MLDVAQAQKRPGPPTTPPLCHLILTAASLLRPPLALGSDPSCVDRGTAGRRRGLEHKRSFPVVCPRFETQVADSSSFWSRGLVILLPSVVLYWTEN